MRSQDLKKRAAQDQSGDDDQRCASEDGRLQETTAGLSRTQPVHKSATRQALGLDGGHDAIREPRLRVDGGQLHVLIKLAQRHFGRSWTTIAAGLWQPSGHLAHVKASTTISRRSRSSPRRTCVLTVLMGRPVTWATSSSDSSPK